MDGIFQSLGIWQQQGEDKNNTVSGGGDLWPVSQPCPHPGTTQEMGPIQQELRLLSRHFSGAPDDVQHWPWCHGAVHCLWESVRPGHVMSACQCCGWWHKTPGPGSYPDLAGHTATLLHPTQQLIRGVSLCCCL